MTAARGSVAAAGSVERIRTNMRMKPLAVVACAALAVTAFTACGDDDDDSPTDTGVTVPAVTGDTTTWPPPASP